MKFLNQTNIKESLENLTKGLSVTVGTFHHTTQGYLNDMAWNHMDQLHRPYIHKTYEESIRIATDKNFATSLTRWGKWPIFITVTDIRVNEGLFYQCMTIAGLFYIHFVIDMKQVDDTVETALTWHIASHRFLKFLHPILNRKFFKLNTKLQKEDHQIRERRFMLRNKGYSFKSDPVDYLSSNLVASNTIYPALDTELIIDLSEIYDQKSIVKINQYEFIVIRDDIHGVLIWPGVCPHEGGALMNGYICGDKIACPWHGLKFSAVNLSAKNPSGSKYGFNYTLNGDLLSITLSSSAQNKSDCMKVVSI